MAIDAVTVSQFLTKERHDTLLAERARRLGQSETERLGEDSARLEASLIAFYERAWDEIDPAPYVHGWHLEAIAEHLQAVAEGDIRKLVINVPPRHSKSIMVSVCFPAWVWARDPAADFPLCGPQIRFLCLSYSDQLAMDHATSCRRLIGSEWYGRRWGGRVQVTRDQDAKSKFDTSAGGSRVAASFHGTVLGRGGDIKIIDDPHKVDEAESEVVRSGVIRAYDGTLKSRITDPRTAATIIIMQRLHEKDLTGHVLESDHEFVHLCLPAEYEWRRHCVTAIGWDDPRGVDDGGEPLVKLDESGNRLPREGAAQDELDNERDGELLWPERFGRAELEQFKANPYEWAGQWQQLPVPRGGGIFKRDWWQLWEPPDGKFPNFDYVVASLDAAYTEKVQNDPSGFTVWGVFHHQHLRQSGLPPDLMQYGSMFSHEDPTTRIMLIDAWRAHLRIHGEEVEYTRDEESGLRSTDETLRKITLRRYERRASASWGLVEKVAHSCRKHKVDVLLIEGKASGLDVAHEIDRLYADENWRVVVIKVKSDKVARAHAVVPVWARGLIYAPDREWSEMVISEMEAFPRGAHDDLTDSATQAIKYLRENALVRYSDEARRDELRSAKYVRRNVRIYPV